MQTNNTGELKDSQDYNKHLKNKDEDGINFRPSPNFKHMKKYLKSKFEESASNSPSSGDQETSSSSSATVEEPERATASTASAMVQPPLPPNPPPPDSPLRTTLKKEIEDDEYTANNEQNKHQSHGSSSDSKANPENKDGPKKDMCRQFARGVCTRGDTCIYAHEIILSQLKDVYTFCKNFQNASGCNLPKCKFVHATVFEKEYYYRSGYIPPHALAHIKDNNSQPPPQQEGSSIASPGVQSEPATVFNTPPPPIVVPNVPPPVVLPAVAVAPPPVGMAGGGDAPALKRDIDELAARDAILGDPIPKKCKNCDINEFRLQCAKQKVEVLLRSNDDITKKMSLLGMKHTKLNSVISDLMKTSPPSISNGNASTSGTGPLPTGSINVRNEKEINSLVDPLKIRFAPNLLSLVAEDNANPKPRFGNMSPALMRLLLKGEPPGPGDHR